MMKKLITGFIIYFNSIKVRLKRTIEGLITTLTITFQFHKGTIKTTFSSNLRSRILYFNSIKVRLKLREFTFSVEHSIIFQFHKGTIKTKRNPKVMLR